MYESISTFSFKVQPVDSPVFCYSEFVVLSPSRCFIIQRLSCRWVWRKSCVLSLYCGSIYIFYLQQLLLWSNTVNFVSVFLKRLLINLLLPDLSVYQWDGSINLKMENVTLRNIYKTILPEAIHSFDHMLCCQIAPACSDSSLSEEVSEKILFWCQTSFSPLHISFDKAHRMYNQHLLYERCLCPPLLRVFSRDWNIISRHISPSAPHFLRNDTQSAGDDCCFSFLRDVYIIAVSLQPLGDKLGKVCLPTWKGCFS